MANMGTVYDRMQSNGGYMTGSRHAMGPALADRAASPAPAAAPDAAAGGGAEAPPNLRDAAATPDSCGGCGNFDGQGKCDMYGVPVTANEVCDSFEAQPEAPEQEPAGEEEPEPMPMPMGPR